ncbi:MAG: IS630 family transposase [Phycisphaerae bacterium]
MARKPTQPNGENCSLVELETAATCAPSRQSHIRLQAIRSLLLGVEPGIVAQLAMVKPRTLSVWVGRFNASGIDGLIDKSRPSRPRKILPQQTPVLKQLVEQPAQIGVTHWTGKKFHGYLRESLALEVGYRTVIRWLHENNFCLKVPQPWPDRQNKLERNAYQERLRRYLADENIELWYLDECGVEGDPHPRRRWAQKGARVRVTKNGDHLRMNVTGMVCPRTGAFYALEFSHTDTETFRCFLQHANRDIQRPRPRNLLIMDNASWHKAKTLPWGVFEPVYLPGYSPDFNPVERL